MAGASTKKTSKKAASEKAASEKALSSPSPASSAKSSSAEALDKSAQVKQRSLANPAGLSGVGLHLGQHTHVRLMPATPYEGRYFVRTDQPGSAPIVATVDNVVQTQLSTELGIDTADGQLTVRTVEHLLAALMALDLDNVRIEIDGPELPLLDGSAQDWVAAISLSGFVTQAEAKPRRTAVSQPTTVQAGDAWVSAFPSHELRFSYGIDFDLAAIGNQWHSWSPHSAPSIGAQGSAQNSFAVEIAPARTFGLAHQIEYLRSQNLIKGGSLENALVCSEAGWLNPPLRFDNEPVRHKLLDLIGDLSLLGDVPTAHYVAYKASHTLHVQLAQKLAQVCSYSHTLSSRQA
jgi:UDP-3-O-[3-hydroxymyristoyl] N-acetylglucosamine deacetylase